MSDPAFVSGVADVLTGSESPSCGRIGLYAPTTTGVIAGAFVHGKTVDRHGVATRTVEAEGQVDTALAPHGDARVQRSIQVNKAVDTWCGRTGSASHATSTCHSVRRGVAPGTQVGRNVLRTRPGPVAIPSVEGNRPMSTLADGTAIAKPAPRPRRSPARSRGFPCGGRRQRSHTARGSHP